MEDNTKQNVILGRGEMFGKGVYAAKGFKKGDVVIQYHLKSLSKNEYENLSDEDKNFVHTHWGVKYLYGEPERYVNHSSNPNTLPDLKNKCDVAIRNIESGEQITTDASKDDI
jgi:hypothetical protein